MRSIVTTGLTVAAAFLAALLLLAPAARAQVDFSPDGSASSVVAAPVAAPQTAAADAAADDGGARTPYRPSYNDPFAPNKRYTGQLISLDFQNADIHNILRLIGEVSGKNVVVSDQVSGRVTLKLTRVPWDQALDTVLASKNLGYIENGNILRIDTLDAIRRSTPDPSDPNTRVRLERKTYTPKYAPVSTLAGELEKGKSLRGSIRVIGNDIYVVDDQETMADLDIIFERNDRVTRQILIEARIVEATAMFEQNLGIRWGGLWDNDANIANKPVNGYYGSNTFGSNNMNPGEIFGAMDINAAARLGVGFLNKAGTLALTAELNASESVGQTKIVSAPRIMAANDEQVYIKQGTQIPYRSGGSATTAQNTEFKDAVMELRVTPHIEENGQIVSLDITLTKDSPGARLDGTSEPSIDTREARTKLMVKDGETVVIGGIITDNQATGSSRVPGLHNLPLLGWLFQNRQINNDKTELLIFITANIIPINI
ncbi:MAG: type IV pilus secretin PilQ [Deltaproteobacteria bacterium]|jgi:type IV pilus assembly protein PilQ|nr:type IV pilus secretin PilQ [Deltaproteobacteria bacterium]